MNYYLYLQSTYKELQSAIGDKICVVAEDISPYNEFGIIEVLENQTEEIRAALLLLTREGVWDVLNAASKFKGQDRVLGVCEHTVFCWI